MKKQYLALTPVMASVVMTGIVLVSSTVKADDNSIVDEINITVPVSCTISGTGMTSHNATINNGLYEDDIGSTTLHAFCNDAEGFAIYAAGYTGDEVGGTNSNKLVGTSASANATIETGLTTTAGNPDVSNWAMKLTATQDSGDTTGTNAFAIDSAPNTSGGADASFSQYHAVPNEYTKVAHKNSGTDMTAVTGGVKLTTTYAAYISKTQSADTYSGQVIYTLVHPSSVVAGRLNVVYDGNGLIFSGGKTKNQVVYNATSSIGTGQVTKKAYAGAYDENGDYYNFGAPAGNEVVTIDGAESIHIAVTYGAPQNNGGPPSDLSIWVGNHPDYTEANTSTALTSCGATNATNGAFSSTGNPNTQVTMECDIASDSVTFYDYSLNTSGAASIGYYAVITGQGDVTTYTKSVDSGTYATPTTRTGQDVFLGWSTNPDANDDAEDPLYTDGADFIANDTLYTNTDGVVTLYAIWGKTFNTAYADAGKTQLSNHYKMQDATDAMCKEIYVGATETLIDSRDNIAYMVGRLKDGKCWMLDNLALDPTDSTTAANMSASNTNATTEAITNYLNGGSSNTGWSNIPVANTTSNFNDGGYTVPRINNLSKDTLVTSYGPASMSGQAKVGIYYNVCAATVGTYCYAQDYGVDIPDTIIDAPQDVCPSNWRMPTGGADGEYAALFNKYDTRQNATNTASLQYNLSTPFSGYYSGNSAHYGSSGAWWSSTIGNPSTMYKMTVELNSVSWKNGSYSRTMGYTLRCLLSN